jgi:hypothetical protein
MPIETFRRPSLSTERKRARTDDHGRVMDPCCGDGRRDGRGRHHCDSGNGSPSTTDEVIERPQLNELRFNSLPEVPPPTMGTPNKHDAGRANPFNRRAIAAAVAALRSCVHDLNPQALRFSRSSRVFRAGSVVIEAFRRRVATRNHKPQENNAFKSFEDLRHETAVMSVARGHRRTDPAAIGSEDVPSIGGRVQRVPVPRSSEYPALRRDHWEVGRPLVRRVSMISPCGQPVGESSHFSCRP